MHVPHQVLDAPQRAHQLVLGSVGRIPGLAPLLGQLQLQLCTLPLQLAGTLAQGLHLQACVQLVARTAITFLCQANTTRYNKSLFGRPVRALALPCGTQVA